MKKTHSIFCAAVLGAAALLSQPAVSIADAGNVYVEGGAAYSQIRDVDGGTSIASGGFNAAVDFTSDYDHGLFVGIEAGLANIAGTNFRAGISAGHMSFDLNKVTGSGAVSYNGTQILAAAGTATKADLEAAGVSTADSAKVYSLNGYHDFELDNSFTPYLGLGVGLADIEYTNDKELVLSAYAGVNYDITENVYGGLRASYHRVNGPTDSFGVNYDDVTAYMVGAVVGYKF